MNFFEGLGLANLLTTQSQLVLERFNDILLNILETLNDITRCDENGTMHDSLLLPHNQSQDGSQCIDDQSQFQYHGHYPDERGYVTDHENRRNELMKSDPVHTTCLKDYLQSQVRIPNLYGFCCSIFSLYLDNRTAKASWSSTL